mmetsp:Transcript_63280/g.87977  ORF Transcript_63280/g.87977 Transcript_63280/m.87977 type:complete len:358 (-) Transcript_63280:194-1267(-)
MKPPDSKADLARGTSVCPDPLGGSARLVGSIWTRPLHRHPQLTWPSSLRALLALAPFEVLTASTVLCGARIRLASLRSVDSENLPRLCLLQGHHSTLHLRHLMHPHVPRLGRRQATLPPVSPPPLGHSGEVRPALALWVHSAGSRGSPPASAVSLLLMTPLALQSRLVHGRSAARAERLLPRGVDRPSGGAAKHVSTQHHCEGQLSSRGPCYPSSQPKRIPKHKDLGCRLQTRPPDYSSAHLQHAPRQSHSVELPPRRPPCPSASFQQRAQRLGHSHAVLSTENSGFPSKKSLHSSRRRGSDVWRPRRCLSRSAARMRLDARTAHFAVLPGAPHPYPSSGPEMHALRQGHSSARLPS